MRLKTPGFHENAATSGGAAIPTSGVQIFIPAALNRPTHTLYSICTAVQPTLQEWTVNRRYSQFLQLRDDILVALTSRSAGPGCPGCASFALALRQFAFPRKSWIRTNRVVRKRVKSLQQFLQLLVERLYNDLPKCNVCGDQVKKMVRPFLIRGAQPIGDSTLSKIQYSLSLHSYAIVKHQPRKDLSASAVSHNAYSYVPTERTDSDPALTDAPSPSVAKVDFASSTISEDSYGKQFGDERCTDTPVALEEALKQIVVIDKRKNTIEDMVTRLSSMWDGYDVEKAPKEIDLSRLSFTQEESTDGEPEFLDDDDDIGMLEENDVSLALLGGNAVFGLDDDEREARPLPVDEVAL